MNRDTKEHLIVSSKSVRSRRIELTLRVDFSPNVNLLGGREGDGRQGGDPVLIDRRADKKNRFVPKFRRYHSKRRNFQVQIHPEIYGRVARHRQEMVESRGTGRKAFLRLDGARNESRARGFKKVICKSGKQKKLILRCAVT